MKLDQLESPEETSLELIYPPTGKKCGIVFEGFTPDSAEWAEWEARIARGGAKKQVILDDGQVRAEIDPLAEENREKLLIKSVKNINGIDDFKSTPNAIQSLLSQKKFGWMLEQWGKHLQKREQFFKEREPSVSDG